MMIYRQVVEKPKILIFKSKGQGISYFQIPPPLPVPPPPLPPPPPPPPHLKGTSGTSVYHYGFHLFSDSFPGFVCR